MIKRLLIANRGEIAIRIARRRRGSASRPSRSIPTTTRAALHVTRADDRRSR